MVHTVLHFVTALFIVSTNRDTCNSEEKHGFRTPFFSCLCSVEYSVVFHLKKKRKRKCPARAPLRARPFLPLGHHAQEAPAGAGQAAQEQDRGGPGPAANAGRRRSPPPRRRVRPRRSWRRRRRRRGGSGGGGRVDQSY